MIRMEAMSMMMTFIIIAHKTNNYDQIIYEKVINFL